MRLSSLLSCLAWVGVVSSLGVLGPLGCTPEPMVVQMPCPPPPKPAAPPPAAKVETIEPRTLDLRLAPSREGGSAVASIDVTMRYSVPPVDFGDARPLVLGLGVGNGDSLEDVSARDSEGTLSLARGGADETNKTNMALWHAERRARGPVTVTYRVKLPPASAPDVASFASGFLALGRAFLLLPATTELYAIRVTWDLANLEESSSGTTSLGGLDLARVRPPSSLASAVWAAGPLEEVAFDDPADGLSFRTTVFSKGKRPLDALDVAPWASRLWQSGLPVAGKGSQGSRGPFELFVRMSGKPGSRFDVNVFGRSAVAVLDDEARFGWPEKRLLARALVRAMMGTSTEGHRLFDEGFAAYFALKSAQGASLVTPTEGLAELVERTERYFSSPLAHATAADLDAPANAAALAQAEDRGFLFAAELDAKLGAKTGAKPLTAILRDIAQKPSPEEAEAGMTPRIPIGLLREAIQKELGQDGEARYKAILIDAKGTPEPSDDVFGPCFKKVKKKIPRYDLGLDPASATAMRVKGLSPKSPAAKAGLKDDEPIESLDLGDGTADKPVKIVVRRKDSTSTITYFPRGEPVDGFSWAFSEKAPASCGVPKAK